MIIGIILFIIGFVIFSWSGYWTGRHSWERPAIFWNIKSEMIITILEFGLIISGLVLIFISNYKVGLGIIIVYVLLLLVMKMIGGEKNSIKTIVKTYNKKKLYNPNKPNKEIFKEILAVRFRGKGWDEKMLKEFADKFDNLREFCSWVISEENPYKFGFDIGYEKSWKNREKLGELIEKIIRKENK